MNLEQYEYRSNETYLDYDFLSVGPNGEIKKVVRFTLIETGRTPFYYLGFGDWNEDQGKIDDFNVTNNKDAEKVLATVCSTVIEFTDHYPDLPIFFEGSTPSRTRLYQMGINKYWSEIDPLFEVDGLDENGNYSQFQKGRNYKAFFIKRKK